MSVAFVPPQKGRPPPSPAQIQKMLDENSQLIQGILDYQSKGKSSECLQYQQILHRNLVYLASIADAVPSLLPPPPTQVIGSGSHQASIEPSRIPSPSMNQSGNVQQTQMNISASGSRGNQPSVSSVVQSSGSGVTAQGSNMPPHTSYNLTSQTAPVHQQSVVNHVQHNSSTQQSSTQATHSSAQSSMNTYSSRSVAPQSYGNIQGGAQQQYSGSYSSSQGQSPHPSYGNSAQSPNSFTQQNSAGNFPNEGSSNFQAPVSQSQGFGNVQQQQIGTSQSQQQQPQHGSQVQEYSSNSVPQTSYTTAPTAVTASQSYTTTQSSQTYVTQTQSYNSTAASASSSAAWYQANNAPQQSFPSSSAPQGYAGGPVSFGSQSAGGSAQSGGYGSPPSNASSQAGFVHHSPSSSAHESPPPTTPIQPNRFPSNFSNYIHYRPSSQQASHTMGPPTNNSNRPQVPSNSSQNQNYSYDQSQNYQYQSQ